MSARAARPSGWRGPCKASSRCDLDLREELEPLALGGLAKASVEGDEVLTGRTPVGPEERCRKLEGVRSAKRMKEKDARRRLSDVLARLHLDPASGQARHALSSLVLLGARQDVVPPQFCKCRIAFDQRYPPNDDRPVFLHNVSQGSTLSSLQGERYKRRRVPELHQPLSRSSRTALTAALPGTAGRGIFQKPFGSFPEPSRMSPARAFSSRWAGISAAARSSGTILAIGFPRSVTITSSPALTRARYSLRLALSLATGALFMNGLL